jgi:hypothetical protein
VLYACDPHWWDYYYEEIKANTKAELWTQSKESQEKYPALNRMPGVSLAGLGHNQLHFGGNSGYQAVNLAYLFGATKIILLGFDMQRTNGEVHYFGEHPYHKKKTGPRPEILANWCRNFDKLAADLKQVGVEVINATRQTALTCFSRANIEDIT